MPTRTQRILGWFTTPAGLIAAAMIAVALFAAFAPMAWAADKGGPPQFLENVAPKRAPFAGCGPSLRARWAVGSIDTASPVTLASEGAAAGVGLGCDWTFSAFLVGVGATYDWAFNDLHTIGVNTDLTLYGRVGIVVHNWMIYGGVGWSQVDASGLGNIDGLKALGGVEVRLATTAPLFLAVEGSRGFYDNALGSTDINATSVMASLKFKFGGK